MIGKLGLAVAALALLAAPAHAEDAAPTPDVPCPNVYGVWETAFLIGASRPWDSTPEPLAPGRWWGGLLMKAYINKDKAVLVWMKDHAGNKASSAYKRDRVIYDGDESFFGRNAGEAVVGAKVIGGAKYDDLEYQFPAQHCLLHIGESRKGATVEGPGQTVIMRKIK